MRKRILMLFIMMATGAAVTLTGCEFSGNGGSSQAAAKTKSDAEVAKYIPDLTAAATKKPTPTVTAAANSKLTSPAVTKAAAEDSTSNSGSGTQDTETGNTSDSEAFESDSSSQQEDYSDESSESQDETSTDSDSAGDTGYDEQNTDEENNDSGESIPFQGESQVILYDRKGNYITVYPDGENWYDAEGIFYMTEDELLTGDCPFINENGESWYLTELPENVDE